MAPGKESGISAMSAWTNNRLLAPGQLRSLKSPCFLRNCVPGTKDSVIFSPREGSIFIIAPPYSKTIEFDHPTLTFRYLQTVPKSKFYLFHQNMGV